MMRQSEYSLNFSNGSELPNMPNKVESHIWLLSLSTRTGLTENLSFETSCLAVLAQRVF